MQVSGLSEAVQVAPRKEVNISFHIVYSIDQKQHDITFIRTYIARENNPQASRTEGTNAIFSVHTALTS